MLLQQNWAAKGKFLFRSESGLWNYRMVRNFLARAALSAARAARDELSTSMALGHALSSKKPGPLPSSGRQICPLSSLDQEIIAYNIHWDLEIVFFQYNIMFCTYQHHNGKKVKIIFEKWKVFKLTKIDEQLHKKWKLLLYYLSRKKSVNHELFSVRPKALFKKTVHCNIF